jgi:hypothetical protein
VKQYLPCLLAFCLGIPAQVMLPAYHGVQARRAPVGGSIILDHAFAGSAGAFATATTRGMNCPSASLMFAIVTSSQVSGGTVIDSTGANTYGSSTPAASALVGGLGISAFWVIGPTVVANMTVTGGNYYSLTLAVCTTGTMTFLTHGDSGPLLTSVDNEVVFAAWATSAESGTFSVDSGFTIIESDYQSGGHWVGAVAAYKIVPTAGTSVNPVLTNSVNGTQNSRLLVSFQP